MSETVHVENYNWFVCDEWWNYLKAVKLLIKTIVWLDLKNYIFINVFVISNFKLMLFGFDNLRLNTSLNSNWTKCMYWGSKDKNAYPSSNNKFYNL